MSFMMECACALLCVESLGAKLPGHVDNRFYAEGVFGGTPPSQRATDVIKFGIAPPLTALLDGPPMNAPTEFARAVCPHDCPDTCAMRVTVEDGRAIKVDGDPDHPPTQGVLCTKVSRYAERMHHPHRLTDSR